MCAVYLPWHHLPGICCLCKRDQQILLLKPDATIWPIRKLHTPEPTPPPFTSTPRPPMTNTVLWKLHRPCKHGLTDLQTVVNAFGGDIKKRKIG